MILSFRLSLTPLLFFSLLSLTLHLPTKVLAQDESSGSFVLLEGMRHLRRDDPREWTEFSEEPDARELVLNFTAEPNDAAWTLELTQHDVKQTWRVQLNDQPLGELVIDENPMRLYFDVPADTLRQGENQLLVRQTPSSEPRPDDIEVGDVQLHATHRDSLLHSATLTVRVKDTDRDQLTPCRITVLRQPSDKPGRMQTLGAESDSQQAVRPGLIYSSAGEVQFGLPPGRYSISAGRGFEYSLATQVIDVKAGESRQLDLQIHREVPLTGYLACDTHTHTLTHSGHGDATIEERMVTLAGEGIELAIATDHNVQIDQAPFAKQQGVDRYFRTAVGNEVTTPVGHINVFPLPADLPPPAYRHETWHTLQETLTALPGNPIRILNHGRDLHAGFRPLGPENFLQCVGQQLDGWPYPFNAMEVVNSSATQNDILQLFHDWMQLLNAGHAITPVGCSDSHDVGRHFIGQGRTYIRVGSSDPSEVDLQEVFESFRQGQVVVSYGLAAELVVGHEESNAVRSGQLATADLLTERGEDRKPTLPLRVRVLGPSWVQASSVQIYINGELAEELELNSDKQPATPGVKFDSRFEVNVPRHDVHVVAIALGPGIESLAWPTAKPYQATSPAWAPKVIGCSGAVQVDVDGDGRFQAASEYAERLVAGSQQHEKANSVSWLLQQLQNYDPVVARFVAHRLTETGFNWFGAEGAKALKAATPEVRAAIVEYLEAYRTSVLARSK